MAKPINITPILRGKHASKFFKKLEANKSAVPSESRMRKIESDTKLFRSITKAY